MLLSKIIAFSKLSNSVNSFSQVPNRAALFRYVQTLKKKCHLNRLAKRIISWFDNTKANGKQFDYRFTGKDSRLFHNNFMYLVDIADAHADTSNERFVIHVIAFICLYLRDAISLFSRLHIADEEISKLKELCLKHHRACALFFSGNATS